jgi:iron complex outermembrane receptor protein
MRQQNAALFLLLLLLFSTPAGGQEPRVSLLVLDRTTRAPIEGISFRSARDRGVSDPQGRLVFRYAPGDTLHFSHVGYGEWFLTGRTLAAAVEAGVTTRARQVIALHPITVLALRPAAGQVQGMGIGREQRLFHDGGAVLNQTAVVSSIRKSGSYGFDPVMRGFKYEQLNVVVDGAQYAASACPNRMDPSTSQIAPNMMEEVEILKGPHSYRYGTSFGGTINFRPAQSHFSASQGLYGRLSTGIESNEGIRRTEALVGGAGSSYDLAAFGSFSRGEDYRTGGAESVPASFSRASLGSRLGLRISSRQEVTLSLNHNEAKDTDFPALPMDLRSDRSWLFSGKHEIRLDGAFLRSWSTTIFGTAVDHLMDNRMRTLDPRKVDATTEAETESFGGRTEGNLGFPEGQLFAGLDLRVERADGERIREFLTGPKAGTVATDNVWNGAQVAKGGVFGEYHLAVGAFQVVASGRLDLHRIEARNLDDGFREANNRSDDTQLNPSFSLGGRRSFQNGASLGVWLGRAQRSGGLVERYINSFPVGLDPYEMLGNPNLEPEVNHQIDLAFDLRGPRSALDVTLFASFLRNYISAEIDPELVARMPSAPGVRRFVNIDRAFIGGFEVSWAQGLGHGLEQAVDMAFTYGQDGVRDEPLPEIAPLDFRYTFSGRWMEGRLQPLVAFRFVSRQSRVSKAFGETPSPSFSIVDLGITFGLRTGIGLRAGIRNLLDQDYYEHLNRSVRGQGSAIHAPGRNMYLVVFVDRM